MRDEQLREELAAWLRPVQQAPAPDVSVIRRRLRRRRARKTITGTVLCALGAGAVALVHVTAGSAPSMVGPGPVSAPPCSGSQLRVDPVAVRVPSNAFSNELLPTTDLLRIRNTGRAACSLEGWPNLAVSAPRAMRAVPVSYGTVSLRPTRRGPVSRVVEPTQVVLPPHTQAAATVTVTYPLAGVGCASAAWSVTPPHSSRPTLVRRSQISGMRQVRLEICQSSTIEVSPVYPAAVPVTQNYPAKAPRQSPASVSTSPPTAGAGPQAAPYFLAFDGFRPRVAVVHDWRTGRITAVIRLPGIEQGFAAAGDDRTFVVAVGSAGGDRFYQLVLSQQGTLAAPLTPLPLPPMPFAGAPFAVSDDGSELALALAQPGNAAEDDEIMVISLVTGSVHVWRSPDPGSVSGMSWADPGSSPATAWAANNRLLFGWTDNRAGRAARRRSGLRLLDTTAPGTNLLASRLLIPASVRVGGLTGLAYPLINSAGTVVFATMVTHAHGNPRAAVVEFSATTGRPLGIVTPLVGESGMGTWCGALWVNPSGSRALAACRVQGEISQGRFTPEDLHFPPGNFSHGTNYFAW
jgi:Protein of unknown function (DUF4232)